MSDRILVVDDEKNIRRTLRMVLAPEGFDVADAATAEEGLALLEKQTADVILLDVNLPGISGLEMLGELKRSAPEAMVIMISGAANVSIAVEATRGGAFDFLEKPLSKERVIVAVRNALRLGTVDRERRELRERDHRRRVMIGDSPAMAALREEIARAAPTSARILILGESGTGKELVARSVHEASERSRGPFVKGNCAAIPEEPSESELFGAGKGAYTGADVSRDGKFLQADGGTLFLDEIGDMSLKAQAKVLRALQEGEIERVGGKDTVRVDVRVIAATNKDLAAESAAGRFREDLYFRLNVVPLRAVPLRERREDVAKLARHFLERFRLENNRPTMGFDADVEIALAAHSWPGNVRELENAVERLAIMARSNKISLADLDRGGIGGRTFPARDDGDAVRPSSAAESDADPPAASTAWIRAEGGLVAARRRFEADAIRHALREADGNVSRAARLLGIDRTNLHKKIQSYGIEDPNGGLS